MPRPRKLRERALLEKARAGTLTADEAVEGRAYFAGEAPGDFDEGERFMFLRWGERRLGELHRVLLAAPESGNLFAVMTACALSLSKNGQRITLPMSDIGRRLNLRSSQLSRAVAALCELDILQFPEPSGRSQTFEMDARLVTRMDETGRKAAAASQAARRRAAAAGRVPLRVVGADDSGAIDDERQPALV